MTNVIITFSGPAGSGKTKALELVKELLEDSAGFNVEHNPENENSIILDTTELVKHP